MRRSEAFSLVEVTLALGVAAFCLVAVFGLLPTGLNLTRAASEKSAAINIAAALVSDARSVEGATNSSPLYGIPIPASVTTGLAQKRQIALFLDGSGGRVSSAPDARYLAVVTLTGPAAGRLDATMMHVLMTWPAQANSTLSTNVTNLDPSNASDPNDAWSKIKTTTATVETIAALSRR